MGLLLIARLAQAQTNAEFRAFWADAFHDGFKTAAQVTKLVADARTANCNAIIAEVRKRGDAYYNSNYEPKAADISPSFDPLQDLIEKAHNTNDGPRIEVHAWIVAYLIWNRQSTPPPQPNHPYLLHPDWLNQDITGATWNGNNYGFDPGHPDVQQYTFDVAMDIVSRYDVDGLSWDYIRYEDNTWGYHHVTVARFHARYGGSGTPAPTDTNWLQFRRDQVTALVRKTYLCGIALKPWVKMSTCCNTRAPGITNTAQWPTSAAYSSTLQDWRAWLEEGIVDMALPMTYFDADGTWASAWARWTTFHKDHRYNRHVVVGPGIYMNTISNSLYQLHDARTPSPNGNYLDGICMYSYAVTGDDGVPQTTFLSALTQPSPYDPNPVPVFPSPVGPPVMFWKTNPTNGHLKGFVYGGSTNTPLDGAVVQLTGPLTRTLTNDGTGFYGKVDLPPGTYSVSARFEGYGSRTNMVAIAAGNVATRDFILVVSGAPVITAQPQSQSVTVGGSATFSVIATGTQPLNYQWRHNGTNLSAATASSLTLADVQPTDAGSYCVVVTSELGSATSADAVLTVTPISTLRFSSPRLEAGRFDVMLSGHGTNAVSVLASTNLLDWQPIAVLPPTNALLPFVDPDAGSFQQRFYRAFAAPMQTLADFEDYSAGTGVMFRQPSYSGSTSACVDTTAGVANFAYVTNGFPAGHAGSRVLQAAWTFKSGVSNPWLRLTTSNASNLPNPTLGFGQTLRFDLYADRDLYVAIGLRETHTDAPIGGDGGTSGTIEWVGGTTSNSTSPPRGRLVTAGQWTNLTFFIPCEPVRASTGNGVLESSTGKGVFEQLTLVPAGDPGTYNLYLDNFQVVNLD